MKLKELLNQYSDVELTQEQEEQFRKYIGIKLKRWRPNQRERYYFIDSCGTIIDSLFHEHNRVDEYRFFTNNCFKTVAEAEFKLQQIKVYYELKNFADDHNSKIDWNTSTFKYYICNKYLDNSSSHRCPCVDHISYAQDIGQIYFSSKDLADQAIRKVSIDKIKKYLFGEK